MVMRVPESSMSRSRAADDFETIRTRIEELRRERLPERGASAKTGAALAGHRGPCAGSIERRPDHRADRLRLRLSRAKVPARPAICSYPGAATAPQWAKSAVLGKEGLGNARLYWVPRQRVGSLHVLRTNDDPV